MIEKKKRNRVGNLTKPMGMAMAHAKLLREMLNDPKCDLVAASRKSQALVSQRNILETTEVEQRMARVEERLEQIAVVDNRNVVQFKRPA